MLRLLGKMIRLSGATKIMCPGLQGLPGHRKTSTGGRTSPGCCQLCGRVRVGAPLREGTGGRDRLGNVNRRK